MITLKELLNKIANKTITINELIEIYELYTIAFKIDNAKITALTK